MATPSAPFARARAIRSPACSGDSGSYQAVPSPRTSAARRRPAVRAAGGEDVDDALSSHGVRDDLTDGVIQLFSAPGGSRSGLGKGGADGLEEGDLGAGGECVGVRHGEGERLR